MAMRSRPLRRRAFLIRTARIIAVVALIWTTLETIFVRHALSKGAVVSDINLSKEKVFIASIHWNNADILRSHWNPAVLELAKAIGKDNVFVSLLESGSWDDSKGALIELDLHLGEAEINRKITLEETTHIDLLEHRPEDMDDGWIRALNGSMQLRRIPYLSVLRNRALEPLYELLKTDQKFDKIIFLNDVAFTTADVQTLFATNAGNYAAACSLDFAKPNSFYDTFALRDIEGHPAIMSRWPYFRAQRSRQALKQSRPVPVKSCWNGIVVMDAAPFYQTSNRLAFRGIADSLARFHLEGSECCLIHADNPLSASKGVFLNPNVRVGYNGSAYQKVNPSDGKPWVSTFGVVWGSWENRVRRWITNEWFSRRRVGSRIAKWRDGAVGRSEPGGDCLINEMQVLAWNGWAHL